MRTASIWAVSIHHIAFWMRYWETSGFSWFMWHAVDEPAVGEAAGAGRGGLGIDEGVEVAGGVRVAGECAVEPVAGWRVGDPDVLHADVVGDEIDDELQAALVESGGEMAVVASSSAGFPTAWTANGCQRRSTRWMLKRERWSRF